MSLTFTQTLTHPPGLLSTGHSGRAVKYVRCHLKTRAHSTSVLTWFQPPLTTYY